MIKRVHIENFRCIREATIDLEPLTVLVGPNASGKSTILEAMTLRRHLTHQDIWMRKAETIRITLTYDTGAGHLVRAPDGQLTGHGFQHSSQTLRLNLDSLRSQNTLAKATSLSEIGNDLPNVFASLARRDQSALASELCRLVPVFSDVDLQPTASGQHQLRFQDRWNNDVWYTPQEVSDGTMLMTAFLTLQYQPGRVDLLAIEEPDRGLHPYLVNQLIALLRKFAVGEIGKKPIQVVLATHSAELLDYVRPEEVRFLNRNRETGALEVYKIDAGSPDWRAAYDEYRESLGSVWLSGGLGGVPGA